MVLFFAVNGQLVTSGPQEVMVSWSMEVTTEVAAKAEAANKTTENCIVYKRVSKLDLVMYEERKEVKILNKSKKRQEQESIYHK
jgi:hypothetical protein